MLNATTIITMPFIQILGVGYINQEENDTESSTWIVNITLFTVTSFYFST